MRKLDEMTLRERVVASQRLNRELIEHLEQNFIPKIHQLRRVTRSDSQREEQGPGDRTVHSAAADALLSDHFSVGVYQQLIAHCESVRRSVQAMTDS